MGITRTMVGTVQGLQRRESLVPFSDMSQVEVYRDGKDVVGLRFLYDDDRGRERSVSIDQSDTFELDRLLSTVRGVSKGTFGGRWVDREGPMKGHPGLILVVSGKNREVGPKPRRGRRKR